MREQSRRISVKNRAEENVQKGKIQQTKQPDKKPPVPSKRQSVTDHR